MKKVLLQRPGRELEHLSPDTIEGGDIINLNDTVLAVGISQRTRPEAIELLAKTFSARRKAPSIPCSLLKSTARGRSGPRCMSMPLYTDPVHT